MQKEDFEQLDANFPKQDKVQAETFIKFATVVQNLAVTIDCAKNYMSNPELVSTLVKKLPQLLHVAHIVDKKLRGVSLQNWSRICQKSGLR
jgi:hypothetical protein